MLKECFKVLAALTAATLGNNEKESSTDDNIVKWTDRNIRTAMKIVAFVIASCSILGNGCLSLCTIPSSVVSRISAKESCASDDKDANEIPNKDSKFARKGYLFWTSLYFILL